MKKQPIPKTDTKKSSPKLTPKQRIEKDADDLVHSQEQEELPEAETGEEEDPDDVIHRPKLRPGTTATEDNLEDPDDLVHGLQEEEEE